MATTCKEEARRFVHRYAVGGAAFAALPIPGTSAMLTTLEMHMFSVIGQIYGESVSGIASAAAGGTFAVMGTGLKWLAFQASMFVPGYGTAVRIGIAVTTIESIGHTVIGHFERKYPGKMFTQPVTPAT